MKKIITLSCVSVSLLFLILLGGSQVSCNKNTDCTADITVVDSVGHPVAGASVKLYANITPPGQVQAQGTTDGAGNWSTTFKLPAIFDIQASKGTWKGSGLIQLQIGGSASATVTIK